MPRSKTQEASKVYTLKITLDGSDPPIWRRVQVTDAMTLGDLHYVVQAAMGWENCHLHEFHVKDRQYGAKGPYGDEDVLDEDKAFLGGLIRQKRQRFKYWYDFGDDWMHSILVETVDAAEPDGQYPRCLDGERACPPEDCGGIYGYYDLLEALGDPGHESHGEYLDWMGGRIDPDAFDVDAVNKELAGKPE